MQEKDITRKKFERHNDVFADIVNVLLFGGKNIISEDLLCDVPTSNLLRIDEKFDYQDRVISKYWKNSQLNIALVGFENQTNPYKSMPLQVICYDCAEYGRQSVREYRHTKKYPVITLILHLGYNKRWKYPKSLRGVLNINKNLLPYVNDYTINVFEIAHLNRDIIDSFESDFWILADYLYQMRTDKTYVPDTGTIKHIEELLLLMSITTGDRRFEQVIDEVLEKKITNMREVLDIIEAGDMEK